MIHAVSILRASALASEKRKLGAKGIEGFFHRSQFSYRLVSAFEDEREGKKAAGDWE